MGEIVDIAKEEKEKNNVRHILSIDFDIIMFPCIKLYNDMSSGNENPTVTWDNIENIRGVDNNFLSIDSNYYKKIVKLVQLTMKNDENIRLVPIISHEEIVKDLKDDSVGYNENKFDIVNIDHHHDIMYRPSDRNSITKFDKYDCTNWAGYLFLKDKIEKYTWIKAPNSDFYDNRLSGKYDIKFDTESIRYLDDIKKVLKDHPFETIYLCLSPQWVPYKFKYLYDLIVELFKREE